MRFKNFDVDASKESSDCVADLLSTSGIRFRRRVIAATDKRRLVHVISVHPDDMGRAGELLSAAWRRRKEDVIRWSRFDRQPYAAGDMLIAREPNEAGYYVSWVHHGESFDDSQFRLVPRGWDHEHCYLCSAKVEPGDEWWVAHLPDHRDEVGLCLECHGRMFGTGSA